MAQPYCIHHAHPDISKFTENFKEDNSLNQIKIVHDLIGMENQPQRTKYNEVENRLQNLVGRYQEMDIIDFLRGISYDLA